MFLDGLDGDTTNTAVNTNGKRRGEDNISCIIRVTQKEINSNDKSFYMYMVGPTPILLSSPFRRPTNNNNIHINTLLIPSHSPVTKVTKKYQKKTPYSPTTTSSSSTTSGSSDDNHNKRKNSSNATRKMTHELLSDDQKRANHIASEQKRRANIRIGFEKLVDIVPTLSSGHRSEALILQKCKLFFQ
jgi:hypothetical protein